MNRLTIPTKDTSSHIKEKPVTFRTDYAGNIPVPNNWLHIFQVAAEQLDSVYLQSRNTYARLVSHTPLHKFAFDEELNEGVSLDGSFRFRQRSGSTVLAKVDYCDCCNSPGRISFFNQRGFETLQLCCPSTIPIYKWARFVQSICQGTPQSETTSEPSGLSPLEKGPIPLRHTPATLVSILDYICDRQASIELTLETPDSTQIRELTPKNISFDDITISAHAERCTFQIGFPAIKSLQLDIEDPETPTLIVTGPQNLQLMAIRPTSEPFSRSCFSAITNDLLST
ncbi:hypothetical protein [Pelagicoccus albus]|uniref:Uncharacterized protein n=1 Tax=Pelagicoccus albus TaxID=415222 RepID=A0A7X1B8U6_9BACT|nr:hypothetical protein [Pelagicoccus albus]MBC2607829.1 hypothetical protein [Pelagicoccus albus]